MNGINNPINMGVCHQTQLDDLMDTQTGMLQIKITVDLYNYNMVFLIYPIL